MGIKSKKQLIKQVFFILASIPFSLFVYEAYYFTKKIIVREVYAGNYVGNSLLSYEIPHVGYGPKNDTLFKVQLTKKNRFHKIYNANYTFDNGHRIIPNNNDSSNKKVYFMGCSFMLGDGLNDHQTLPYFFNTFSENKFNSKNFAFSGYGPHQALRLIEKGNLFNSNNEHIFVFLLLPQHIERAAGMVNWDKNGPKYVIENNDVNFVGTFSKEIKKSDNLIATIFKTSTLYDKFLKPKIKKADVELTYLIALKMHQLLNQKNVRFILLIHDSSTIFSKKNEHEELLYNKINSTQIEHYYISSVIPKIKSEPEKYFIKGDGHPNENYNKELAKFLSDSLLKK
ncbi:MAG: hypothetical protein ACLGGV_04580 [Bacteroidia bacterium]